MAKLVAAVATPHAPMLPQQVAQAPGQLKAEALMGEVRRRLEAAAPDVIIVVASDHFTNFFYNNLPQFCVGVVESAEGPSETYCVMPRRKIRGDTGLARGLLNHGLNAGFDLAIAQELRLDHSVVVPLHFVAPSEDIPVVPFYINGLAPPLPLARRCYALGQNIRRFIEQWDSDQRVALLASGSISLEVGGPQVGWTDEPWVATVVDHLGRGAYRNLARRATEKRMTAAGNVSGELLCWIAVTGAMGDTRPSFLETDGGSGYAAWDLV
ncbi:MAG: hypothetical protein IIB30_08980 [Chloroflexi bacterium]|nr:hypothetical protein [Chloroflexota bacterium]MCH8226534.1 hypothetical protein [Chloroflexota bacterium]